MNSKKLFGLSVLVLLLAASAPVLAAEPVPGADSLQALTGTPAPVKADCGFNLEAALAPQASACPAPRNAVAMPSLPALNGQAETPEFLAGFRTCRCSCGAPCKTDADCGPGGICGAGITCC